MKYIEKHYNTGIVTAHKKALIENHLDESNLANPAIRPGRSGADLYEMVRDMPTFQQLKQQMYEDQGGICCYCGVRLQQPFNPQYRVEHVLPKESHRELVGEYSNLLLSCRLSKEEVEEKANARRKDRKKFSHCDEAKGSVEITYSPLQPDCANHFQYDITGNVVGNDDKAEKDVETLGLQCEYLKKRRKAAIEGYIYVSDSIMLEDEELIQLKESIMNRDTDNKHREFCFVIQNAIENLLTTH